MKPPLPFARSLVRPVAIVLLVLAACLAVWHFTRDSGDGRESTAEAARRRVAPARAETRPPLDAEQERRRKASMAAAAEKWYQELLEQHPYFKPNFREVPDGENGYLQLLLFADKHAPLPDELKMMFRGEEPWDAAKLDAWMAANPDYLADILEVARLQDRSTKGIDYLQFAKGGIAAKLSEAALVLRASARVAMEAGDMATAQNYYWNSRSLGHHVIGIEVPSLLHEVVYAGMRSGERKDFQRDILPLLAGNPEALAEWRKTLSRVEPVGSEIARAYIGEWNTAIRSFAIPALLGDTSQVGEGFQLPDVDKFVEALSAMVEGTTRDIGKSVPGRLDLPADPFPLAEDGLSKESKDHLGEMARGYRSLLQAMTHQVTADAMGMAAVQIMLGEEPNFDPVSKLPFKWNAESRVLSLPEGSPGDVTVKVP